MAPRNALMALLAVLASCSDDAMWSPTDGVKALDAVEQALAKVVALPLSPEQSKKAKHVADDVRNAIAAVQSKSNLTKAERNAKVGAAVQELANLEADFNQAKKAEVPDKQAALKAKLTKLQKELVEKKEELAKDESMVKLATLQKELAEKKLELQKLIEKKAKAEASHKAGAADVAEESALVAKLTNMTSSLAKIKGKKSDLPAPLKAVLSEVQAFSKKQSDDLNRMDATNKKATADLEFQLKKVIPTKGKDDPLIKGQSLLRRLEKEEHRQYMKARAQKKAMLTELKNVEQSIEQHDAKRLQNVLVYMQHQTKALAAKSGNFLH